MVRRLLALVLVTWLGPVVAEPIVKIKSVKGLTHLLSKVEKSGGIDADFTTLRLQLHLEDVYISQGSTLYLECGAIAEAMTSAVNEGLDKEQIAERLLRRFQKGEFSEN
jgi:hypothetical protein